MCYNLSFIVFSETIGYKLGAMSNYLNPYDEGAKQFCHNCGKEMDVDIVAHYIDERHYETEDGNIGVYDTHCIVKCKACNKITHCVYTENSEEMEEYTDEMGEYAVRPSVWRVGYYPSVKFPDFRKEVIEGFCPKYIQEIISEGYIAYQNELYTLASVSLRMIIDAICQDAEARQLIPKAKRSELLNAGFISKSSYNIIDNIVNNANQAIHRLVSLSKTELESAFTILSVLIEALYVMPAKSGAIRVTPSTRR